MEEQEIKIEKETKVPKGYFCYNRDTDIHCENLGERQGKVPGLSRSICSFLDEKILGELTDKFAQAIVVAKCETCLEACKKGNENVKT